MVISNKNIIFFILLIISVDFSGDSVIRGLPIDTQNYSLFFKITLSLLFTISLVLTKIRIRLNYSLAPLFAICMTLFIGFTSGIGSNKPIDVINETIPFLFILLFLPISSLSKPISPDSINKCISIFIYIIFTKIVIYSVLTLLFSGSISWKILLNQSPLLCIPLSILIARVSVGNIPFYKGLSLLLLTIICLVFAQSRMLYLALLGIILLNTFKINLKIILILLICFFGSIQIYFVLLSSSFTNVSGHLYGASMEEGLDYRLVQLSIILERYVNYPITGCGFGCYNSDYLTYAELAKPYLLELDILNFFSKVGFLGTFFYVLAYWFLFRLIGRLKDVEMKRTARALFVSLVALLLYSLGQTMHQSVVYWIYLAFVYGLVVAHLKHQDQCEVGEKR